MSEEQGVGESEDGGILGDFLGRINHVEFLVLEGKEVAGCVNCQWGSARGAGGRRCCFHGRGT